MITALLTMVLALCWIHGFHFLFLQGEIFYSVWNWIDNRMPEWFMKPVFDCPYCMASVHGTLFYFLFCNDNPIYMWPIFCVGLCGLVVLTDKK